ncbi:hypothetical protein OSB04_004074 [Centaurea solstitialis]|uniref:HVA22-like protein n=1 Tax=Centaurea solstitialis TaxID=347529 RepID=A0AA38TW42_9ASTR|nr:hypothetical protein OSB04_004074 [Centaurea solstitialis]
MGRSGAAAGDLLLLIAQNFDVLAGPVVSLAYPLYASIRAIETKSVADDQQWLTYWVLYSMITLFELTFAKLIEWIPFWSYAKLIVTCWLVIPQFSGAAYVYEHYVRPFYMGKQTINIFYVPSKKDVFSKEDDILVAAEKYIQENGPDAFQEIIHPQPEIRLGPLGILLGGHRFESCKAIEDFPGCSPRTLGLVESDREVKYRGSNFISEDDYAICNPARYGTGTGAVPAATPLRVTSTVPGTLIRLIWVWMNWYDESHDDITEARLYQNIFASHFGQLEIIFLWTSGNLFHVAWQENFESWVQDPLHVRPIAHAIWDPHFGQPAVEAFTRGGALGPVNIAYW